MILPTPSPLLKEVERETEATKDKVQTTRLESTAHVQPPIVQVPIQDLNVAPKPNHKPSIPYPSRLNDQKLQEKTNTQMLKFLQIFQRLHFDLSFADALLHIPKSASTFKSLLSNKEKLFELANTSLIENCSASCMALADLGASINLMPLSVWKKLSLSDLTPTRMTLELATRSFAYPAGIAEDVFVQVSKFTFPADFVVVDYAVDPYVPLILGRPFLRMACALVDVHEEELILRDGDENLIFHADSTPKHPHKHGNDTTPLSDSSPSLTPFETSDFLLEAFANELALLDPFPPRNEDNNFDFEADLREIEFLLNKDPSTESDIKNIDPILKKLIDEPALDYLHPPGYDDDDDDDLFDLKSDNDEWKKLFLLDNDSTIPEESSEIASFSSSPFRNEDRVFNPDHNFLSISSDKELMFFLELTVIETLLSFSSENEDKVFNPGILTSKGIRYLTLAPKKVTQKLGDPGKFLIPCDFSELVECLDLVDLGASINLMPLLVWKNLSLPKLTTTRMTLELADRSVAYPKGVAEDVFVKVGKFYFLADFVSVDYNVDPRVPLILRRPFLRTARDLIDVHGEELTLRVNDEAITFNVEKTSRYSYKYNDESVNEIDVIDVTCEEYAQEVLRFLDISKSGNPTQSFDPIIKISSPSLTLFKGGYLLLLKKLLNDDPSSTLPPKELNSKELKTIKSTSDDLPELELKDLPSHLEYAYLEVQHQRRVNLKIHKVIKKEVVKLLDAGLIYPISDSPWVSPVHCVPKKGCMTVVTNEDNKLIPTRLVTRWRIFIDYRKLNDVTRKDHFPLPFMDQMLECLAGNEYYCFLDGFSGYFQIPIDPQDQEKTTFTCPYGTFAYRHMPFGLCNAPGTFCGKLEGGLNSLPLFNLRF
nr:reverse transcriptase domain-containing protein [Tanacetum cinerariifolium]